MTECQEVAHSMQTNTPKFNSFDGAIEWVRERMPEESMTVIDNVAWALWSAQH